MPKRLAIVGAGYIGLEIGMAFAKLGAAVSVLEAQDTILPQYDAQLTRPVSRKLRELGIDVHTGVTATDFTARELGFEGTDGRSGILPADKVLVTVGNTPATSK